MSLIGPHYVVEAHSGAIVVRFDIRPTLAAKHALKAHGFKLRDSFNYVRKDDHNGRNAADFLVKRLEELYGLA